MDWLREWRPEDADDIEQARVAVGRRTRVASRYPALARALDDRGSTAGEPTIHDAATAAVEHKGSGAAVDPGIAARVGAYLDADFSSVRVHSDPLSQQATEAMARGRSRMAATCSWGPARAAASSASWRTS